ncbi:head-tail connector protein [Halomonas sp. HMF6819]|uniref:head-tail connector protein n=1 Tax=Halomonas sp. HMF6819 TaxID=3373085 RepID=UPI0037AEDBC2
MLELEIIKQHLRLEPEDDEDDVLLETYCNAAARYVENHTGRKLYATANDVPKDVDGNVIYDNALVLDDDVTTAILLLIGHWYANRESVVVGVNASALPMAVSALIDPYRHFFF